MYVPSPLFGNICQRRKNKRISGEMLGNALIKTLPRHIFGFIRFFSWKTNEIHYYVVFTFSRLTCVCEQNAIIHYDEIDG